VRSLVILVVALAGFAFIVAEPHKRAQALLESEEAALAEIRARGRAAPRDGVDFAAGYEFRWAESAVLLARPRDSGSRWFATADGEEVYEYDPALFQTGRDGVSTGPMVRYLLLRSTDRPAASRPPGWKPVP